MLDEAKKEYEQIEVPAAFHERVEETLRIAQERKKQKGRLMRMKKRKQILKAAAGVAAAAAIVFTTALNTSVAFAKEMSGYPVIGTVAKLLTFRSYESEEDGIGISVEIPSLEMIGEEVPGMSKEVNEEIYELCTRYADEAVERAKEYRKAFLETGGTEEEWLAHNIEIKVAYEIKSQTPDYLSFVVSGTENWSSAYSESRYYTIDLAEGRLVSLADILGEDYIELVNTSIQNQIPEKEDELGMKFFTTQEGGFTSVSEETRFYVNAVGNPVIVFEKYEVAPGAAGEVEFEIKERSGI